MVLYSNTILTKSMKSWSEQELVCTYTSLHSTLVQCRLKPHLQKLDNEAPTGLKNVCTKNDIDFQLISPHLNHWNAPEQAISTWKDHFITGLNSTDKNNPLICGATSHHNVLWLSTYYDVPESIHICPPKPNSMATLTSNSGWAQQIMMVVKCWHKCHQSSA